MPQRDRYGGGSDMSEKKWTAAQRAAIDYRGRNLLVSAAAGSGKTATLTERIIRLIADDETHADISRMLAVTFTKAAAEELRSRVASALEELAAADPENRRISEQLCRVGDAMICTMDSFFLSCVKPMFDKVGLPADFRIGDPAELASVRETAMEETVEVLFDPANEERSERFLAIAEAIDSARTEEGLDKILLDFEADADRHGIGEAELCEYADELCEYADHDILTTHFGDCILSELTSGLRHYGSAFSRLAELMSEDEGLLKSYVPAAYRAAEYCGSCLEAAEARDTDRLRVLLADIPSDRIMTKDPTDESEIFKKLRGEFREFISELRDNFFSDSAEVCADVMNKTAELCRGAGEMIGEFRRHYGELKRQKGIADYSDITKMAASLLTDDDGTPTSYGETVAARYDYVFIDEYQDTSVFQDRIFASVSSKCGRFMVGDIKQSIYRFRGGEPAVFTGYREAWSSGDEGNTVFMSENFRCSEHITEFVNAVSRYMFPYGVIPFEDGDLLVHARAEQEGYAEPPVEVCLIERPSRQSGGRYGQTERAENYEETVPPAAVLEAEYVAKRIRHMLDFETLPDGSPVKPTDIAVMQRDMKSRIDVIKAVFAKYGIPMNELDDKPLLERPEILLITCILRAVDNPERDIPLAGAMRSAVFGFDMGQLALIRSIYSSEVGKGSLWEAVRYVAYNAESADEELRRMCCDFCEKLGEYRTAARVMSAASFIYRLICEPEVVYAIENEGGAGATDRAMRLYELARVGNTGLYEFLVYIEHMERTGSENTDGGNEGGVSLITVHHSKGLEFPICFLMNCTKKYSRNDAKKHMILDRSFGVALRLPDESGLVRCDNILRRLAVLRALRENSYEEMRVLYVAMTRARERLIVTGVTTGSSEKLTEKARRDARFYGEYCVRSKDCWMSMILEALELYGGRFASVAVVPYEKEAETSEVSEPFAESDCFESLPSEISTAENGEKEAARLTELFARRIGFEYGYAHLRNIPSKLTVSRLYPEILDEYDDGATELESEPVKAPSVPRFMTDGAYSSADAGSAAHVFLQFCDFERLSTLGAEAELVRLINEGYMSRAQGDAADLDYVETFRRSGFFERILSASEVKREFRFNAAIPAGMLTGDEKKREALEKDGVDVIAQGVIDIVFTDSDGLLVLADYKTDRLTPYELQNRAAASAKLWRRHGNQLKYYALVCEKLFGKRPDETLIYSMPLGDTV